jgi:hypothetical protein
VLLLASVLPNLGHAETGSQNRLDRETVEPVGQFVELWVDADQIEYSGMVQIRLRVKKETALPPPPPRGRSPLATIC